MAGIDFVHQNGVDYEIVPEIAPRFKTTVNYAAGDCVIYNAEAYRFKTAHLAGAWIGTDAEKFLVGEELGAIKEDLKHYNSYNAFVDPANGYAYGDITWTMANGTVHAIGTTGNSVSYKTLYQNANALPTWMIPGDKYYVKYSGVKVGFRIYDSNNNTILATSRDTYFTVPADLTGCTIRLFVPKNTSNVDEFIKLPAFLNAKSNADIADELEDVKEELENVNEENEELSYDINYLKSGLSDSIESVYITPALNISQNGIVATLESDGRLKVYGTSDATRRLLCLNGQNQIAISSTPFSKTIDAGVYELYTEITGHLSQNVSWQYTYTTFANMVISVSNNEPRMTVNFTNPAMVGFAFATGVDFGTPDDPTYISFSAKKIFLKDAVLFTPQSLESNQKDQTRSNIDAVGNDTLYRYNFFDALKLASSSGGTYKGITYTKNSNGTWTIDGTADGQSFRNLIESTDAVPRYIIPGRKYKFLFHDGTIPIKLFFYKNGSIDSSETYTEDFEITIPEDIGGIIVRFQIVDGTVVDNVTVNYEFVPETVTSIDNSYTYNTTVNKTEQIYNNTFNQTVSPTITADTNGWLQAVDTSESADESGKTDMAPAIMAMLNSTGYCHLGEGVFYVSGNIDMPVNSTLIGCGRKTIIRLLASVSSGYCVKIQSYNTVSNILFRGASSVVFGENEGTRTAILFVANHDGQEGETAYDSQACMIDNVWIEKFSGSGLKCHNTSMNVSKGLYAVNLYIANCWAGINIDYYSEFNKFTNVCTYSCKYGCINNGGNNVFTACTFHATTVGFYVDGTQPNSAHGQINGCTFCHIGSNTGSAITIENAANGFVINDCQIWYCSVDITNSDGIIFSGCEFGRGPVYPDASSGIGAKINVTGGNLVMFTGCVFMKDTQYPPSITITNNTKTKFSSCYGGDTGNVVDG